MGLGTHGAAMGMCTAYSREKTFIVRAPEHSPIHGMSRWKSWQISSSQLDVVDRRRGASGRMIGCRWIYGGLVGELDDDGLLDFVYSDEVEIRMDKEGFSDHLRDAHEAHFIR